MPSNLAYFDSGFAIDLLSASIVRHLQTQNQGRVGRVSRYLATFLKKLLTARRQVDNNDITN